MHKLLLFFFLFYSYSLISQFSLTVRGKSESNGQILLFKNKNQINTFNVSTSGKYTIPNLEPGNTYNLHFLPKDQKVNVQKTVFIDLTAGKLKVDSELEISVNLEKINEFKSIDVFHEPILIIRLGKNNTLENDVVYSRKQQKKIESFKISYNGETQESASILTVDSSVNSAKEKAPKTKFVNINGLVMHEDGSPIKNQTFEIVFQDDNFKKIKTQTFATNERGDYSINLDIGHKYLVLFSIPGKVDYEIRVSTNLTAEKAAVSMQTVNLIMKDQTPKMKKDLYNFSVSYFGRTHHFVNVKPDRFLQRYELNETAGFKTPKKALLFFKNSFTNKEMNQILSRVATYSEFVKLLDNEYKIDEKKSPFIKFFHPKTEKKDQDLLVTYQQILTHFFEEKNSIKDLSWVKAKFNYSQHQFNPVKNGVIKNYTLNISANNTVKQLTLSLVKVDSGWKYHHLSN